MAPKKKKQVKTKVKKKKWVSIVAPKIFNNIILGETHVSEDEQITKKYMTLNLMPILNDMRKQSYEARFKIVSYKEGKAKAELIGLRMTPGAVKRLIRRGRNKVDDSFLAKLKDGKVVRIKPAVITINNCSKGAQTAIRIAIKDKLKAILKGMILDDFVKEIIDGKMNKLLKTVANEHHPTRNVNIRSVILTKTSIESIVNVNKAKKEDVIESKKDFVNEDVEVVKEINKNINKETPKKEIIEDNKTE